MNVIQNLIWSGRAVTQMTGHIEADDRSRSILSLSIHHNGEFVVKPPRGHNGPGWEGAAEICQLE